MATCDVYRAITIVKMFSMQNPKKPAHAKLLTMKRVSK